jgi:hypothetical protein
LIPSPFIVLIIPFSLPLFNEKAIDAFTSIASFLNLSTSPQREALYSFLHYSVAASGINLPIDSITLTTDLNAVTSTAIADNTILIILNLPT